MLIFESKFIMARILPQQTFLKISGDVQKLKVVIKIFSTFSSSLPILPPGYGVFCQLNVKIISLFLCFGLELFESVVKHYVTMEVFLFLLISQFIGDG